MNKNNDNKLVPKLRFPEFKDVGAWEESTIDSIGEVVSGGTPSKEEKEYWGGDFVWITAQDFKGKYIFDSVFKLTKKGKEKSRIIPKDSVLVTCIASIGLNAINKVECATNQQINSVICNPENYYEFIYYSITHNGNRLKDLAGQTAVPIVSKSVFEKFIIHIPKSFAEQQKIAACLSSLDEVITAESQKLELLKEHKKGLLQNLFPQEGETVPKLRFKEFEDSGEWEENYLNEISPAIFDGTHQTPTYTENGIPFFSVENIISGNKNKFISQEDYLLATSKNKPEKGDIIVTRIGNIGTSKVIDWDYEFSIYVTLAVVKKSPLFDSQFLHGYFQSSRYQKEILSKSLLNAIPCKINMDELKKTKILLPPDKEKKEQQKIAACLSSLDELITAQTKKIELLQLHKKGLLQGLFPTINEQNG